MKQMQVAQFSGPVLRIEERPSLSFSHARWPLSFLVSLVFTSMVGLTGTAFKREGILPDAPPILVDYLSIPLPRPKPIKPVSVPTPKPPAPVPEENRLDRKPNMPAAPILAMDHAPGPADLTARAPVSPTIPLRVESAAQLDNVEFEPIFNPKPGYPLVAFRAGIEGWVDVDLVVGIDGRVDGFEITDYSGHRSFVREARMVLPNWRFPPPRKNGRKLRVKYYYRINFRLD